LDTRNTDRVRTEKNLEVDRTSALKPAITVCIPNYNGAGESENGNTILDDCLTSVLSQGLGDALEIIVFDDASTDRSVSLLEESYPSVTLIKSKKNVGYCKANNIMAKHARGHFLLLLNNDAELLPGAIIALLDASKIDPEAIFSLKQYQSGTRELLDIGMGMDFCATPYPIKEENSKHLVTVIGACLWVTREFFLQVGGFPEWFESIAEDMYLCLYARALGRQIKVLPTSGYLHQSGFSFGGGKADTTGKTSFRRRFLSERNRMCVLLIFFPTIALVPAAAISLISWSLEALVLIVKHRSLDPLTRIYLPALSGVISRLSLIAKYRREIQTRNTQSTIEFLEPLSLSPVKLRFFLINGTPELR
jgi:GT2 family glycosyltransferase